MKIKRAARGERGTVEAVLLKLASIATMSQILSLDNIPRLLGRNDFRLTRLRRAHVKQHEREHKQSNELHPARHEVI